MLSVPPLPRLIVEPTVRAALEEDLGRAGDVTTEATIEADARCRADMRAREDGVLAGMDCAMIAFQLVDPGLTIDLRLNDGARIARGDVAMTIEGSARSILIAERVALNFAGRLSGVATLTRRYADAIAHTKARIACTRKTTPGLRALEKRAVRLGGGANHRFGLDDAILIKDNHIAAAGGVTAALTRARAYAGHLLCIEIEVDTLTQMEEALATGVPNVIMLDNMGPELLREAVRLNRGRVVLEASGGVNLATVAAIAETGVDVISSGALTHSARVLDLGLDF